MGPGLGAKANNDDNEASELKASEPDGKNNDDEMSLEPTSRPRLRQEIFMSTTSQQQQPQHGRRGDRQQRRPPPPRSEHRPPTRRTTTVKKSRQQQQAPPTSAYTEEMESDLTKPRPRNSGNISTNARSVPSCTDDDFNNGPSSIFVFYLWYSASKHIF